AAHHGPVRQARLGSALRLQARARPAVILVDTSVWSLALRRDRVAATREVEALSVALERGDACLTGAILQEGLQGFADASRTRRLVGYLAPLPLLALHRGDYVYAAEIRNKCRVKGVTVSTIGAQIAAAAIDHKCALLTVDKDFEAVARHFPLRLA